MCCFRRFFLHIKPIKRNYYNTKIATCQQFFDKNPSKCIFFYRLYNCIAYKVRTICILCKPIQKSSIVLDKIKTIFCKSNRKKALAKLPALRYNKEESCVRKRLLQERKTLWKYNFEMRLEKARAR